MYIIACIHTNSSIKVYIYIYIYIYGRTVITGMVCFCTSQNKHTFDKFSMSLKTKETLSKSNQNLRKYKKCCEKPIKPRQIPKKPTLYQINICKSSVCERDQLGVYGLAEACKQTQKIQFSETLWEIWPWTTVGSQTQKSKVGHPKVGETIEKTQKTQKIQFSDTL